MLSKVQEELKRAGICLLFLILLLGRGQLVGILRGKKIAMHGGIEKLRNAAGIAGLPQNPHELCDDGLSRHVIGFYDIVFLFDLMAYLVVVMSLPSESTCVVMTMVLPA